MRQLMILNASKHVDYQGKLTLSGCWRLLLVSFLSFPFCWWVVVSTRDAAEWWSVSKLITLIFLLSAEVTVSNTLKFLTCLVLFAMHRNIHVTCIASTSNWCLLNLPMNILFLSRQSLQKSRVSNRSSNHTMKKAMVCFFPLFN